MKTNWRELRESLANSDPFNTFSTFNHGPGVQEENQSNKQNGLVKTVNSAKSPKTATNRPESPMAKSVKSAESRFTDARNSWEWIVELAAIFEFDAGMDRDEANTEAFVRWYRRFVEDQ